MCSTGLKQPKGREGGDFLAGLLKSMKKKIIISLRVQTSIKPQLECVQQFTHLESDGVQ